MAGTVAEPKLSFTAEERYDDDLTLQFAGQGQLMTKLSPKVGLEVKDPTLESNGWYAADLLMRHGSGKVTLDHRLGLDLKKSFSRRFAVQAQVQAWRVSDPSSLPRLGMIRTPDPVLYGKGQLATIGQLSERLGLRVAYAFEAAKVYDALNRAPGFVHTPSAALTYALTRRAAVGVEYRYQLFAFGAEAAQAHGAVGTFNYRITRLWALGLKGGPVYYLGAGTAGWVPRATLELQRDGEQLDFGLAAGHDLVGASGFTAAIWADFASVIAEYKFSDQLRVFGAASYYRNGQAPNLGWGFAGAQVGGAAAVSGYGAGTGVEWMFTRQLAVQGTFDRYAQVGVTGGLAAADLARNVAAVRLVWTAW